MRGIKGQYSCRSCGGLFVSRVADRNRGWAQYCSKSCKQVSQEKVKKFLTVLKTGIKR